MKKVNLLATAVLAAAFAMPAQADYTPNVNFSGYMRSGVSSQHVNGYATGLAGRLGAEQDTYGEIGLGTDVAKIDDTVWSVYTMFAYKTKIDGGSWQDNRAGADGNFGDDGANAGHWSAANGFRQYFVSVKGLMDWDKDATIWVGKKYVRREDIYITDNIYQDISGMGAGIDYMQVGPGKLSLAWVRHDFHNQKYINDNGDVLDRNNWLSYHIFDVEYDLPAWDGATLEFRGTVKLPKKDTDNKEYYTKANGSQAMMIELNQGYSLGWNKSVVRYIHGNVDQTGDANSAPTKMGAQYNSIGEDATYNTWSNNSGDKNAYRWQFYNFGETHFTDNVGMFHVIAGTFADGYDNSITSKDSDKAFQLVVRPYLKLTKMTRLLAEGGFFTSTDKYINGSKVNKQVQKLTLAYALTPDAGNFWSRPEIRFYGTYLHSNGAYDLSEWSKAPKNNAFVVGVQAEAWW